MVQKAISIEERKLMENNPTERLTPEQGEQPVNQTQPMTSQSPMNQAIPSQPAARQGSASRSGMATAAMVLGIVAVVLSFLPVINGLSIVLGIIGLVLGIVALSSIKKGLHGGKGFAAAGIVLNAIALLLVVLMMASCGAALHGHPSSVSSSSPSISTEKPNDTSSGAGNENSTNSKPEKDTPSTDDSSNSSVSSNDAVSPDFKVKMDKYEKFFDSYVEFMKEYNDNPTNASLLRKSAKMLSDEAEMIKEFDSIDSSKLSAADAAYYLEVQSRVYKKIAEVE